MSITISYRKEAIREIYFNNKNGIAMRLIGWTFLGTLLSLIASCQRNLLENRVIAKSETVNRSISNMQMVTVPEGYMLAWQDEFDSLGLNSERWKYRIGVSQDSYQRSENVTFDTAGPGSVHINLKKEVYGGKNYTGGGIITKIPDSYGYYEVKARVDGGYGWHEAFWAAGISGFDDPDPLFNDSTGQLEIDCFEHYAGYHAQQFTYGAIEWAPYRGAINRDYKTTTENLADSYNIYGFEYTPEYLNYYFNGTLLKTVDLRESPRHDLYLWLSCIATEPDADSSGTVRFDYIKAYTISSSAYAVRRVPFISYLDSIRGPQHSNGTDLWIQAEDFTYKNNWTAERDIASTIILRGFSAYNSGRDSTQLIANTHIPVTMPGAYHLWVRSKDFLSQPGIRKFMVKINGITSSTVFGTHGQDGYGWQYGGSFNMVNGLNLLELYDAYQYFARCDKMLLTTDSLFVPSRVGAPSNVTHQ